MSTPPSSRGRRQTDVDSTVRRPDEPPAAAVILVSRAPEAKYEIREEIGHGGLGRVFAAVDTDIGREVALKVMREDVESDFLERFLLEGRVTGRLEHPNIVPVHDVGFLPGKDGRKQLYFTMKRVQGRDLERILKEIAGEDEGARREFPLRRLVDHFHDICLAVAFAHSKGVVHRDLKPSNIMIGEFGETLLVDWGIAKVLPRSQDHASSPDPVVDSNPPGGPRPHAERDAGPPAGPPPSSLTLEGEVIGTPEYMAPEQASGFVSDIDERTDVWSLGAILYEILTLRPPFEGDSAEEVMSKVRTAKVERPSTAIRFVPAPGVGTTAPPPVPPWGIPPELEAICLRCLARKQGNRYQKADELASEIRLYLDGVKERERAHRLADEAVGRARAAIAEYRRLEAGVRPAEEGVRQLEIRLPGSADKTPLWSAEDRLRTLRLESVEALNLADSELAAALGHEGVHAGARALKAELAWERFVEAETSGDEAEMLRYRRVVERYNDGAWDRRLRGDGTLTLQTRRYPCRCLIEGREVDPSDLKHLGYHPFSGRALDHHQGAEGLAEYEPRAPVRLRVHGPSCVASPLDGVGVWVFRYEEVGRRMVPTTPPLNLPGSSPGHVGRPLSAAVLDRLFASDSPFRPQGPGLFLGSTPIQSAPLPLGSYLLILVREGFEPVRCPVLVPRCGDVVQKVTLFTADEIPAGFVLVTGGPFGYQGDASVPNASPLRTLELDDFFLATHPITCGAYAGFLNARAAQSPEEAARRVPRASEDSGFFWPGPPYVVPTPAWLSAAPAALRAQAHRLEHAASDWEEDWPVLAISWEDAIAFGDWARERSGFAFALPHEMQWEKAARGPDRRPFPWGRVMDERWFNTNRTHPDGMRPASVEAFPGDESPYGVRGLAGNSRDVCLNDPVQDFCDWRITRGGRWSHSGLYGRATMRHGFLPKMVDHGNGFRLAAPIRLPQQCEC